MFRSRRLVLATACLTSALLPGAAEAGFPNPFKRKKPAESVPAAPELRAAEMEAASLYAQGTSDEAAGRGGAAEKIYRRVVRDFPFTSVAPAAQFRIASAYEQDGKYKKAFDEYQELIETYRQTPQFSEALDRQFGIAMLGRKERTGSFLGIPRRMDPTDLLEMFNKIIGNAPQGSHAAEAQFEIGQIYDDENDPDLAIAAYRKVVENHPQHPLAKEAQVRVSKTYLGKVQEGSRDTSNLKEAREATEEAMGLFPDPAADLADTQSIIDEAEAEASYKMGRFYEKRGNLRAAMIYYSEVLKSPGAPHYEEVRDRVNEMSSRDPKLMDSVKDLAVDTKDLAVPAAVDLKAKAEYFGPPLLATRKPSGLRRPGMRQGDVIPITPLEEPDLPSGSDRMTRPDDSLLNPDTVPLPDPTAPVPPPSTPGLEPPTLKPDLPDSPAPEPAPADPAKPE